MRKSKTKNKIIPLILRFSFIILTLLTIMITIFIVYTQKNLPNIDTILAFNTNDRQIVKILYNDNYNIIKEYNNDSGNDVSYQNISKNLINALIATEDRRFFKHFGIDVFGITRAFVVNIKNKGFVQGGSTLTQQLAKMIIENNKKNFSRKFKEMLLAFRLEKFFTKEEIITLYLNRAYFGAGKVGIKSASNFYFNKSPSDLTIEESAVLVGLLKAPSKFSPTNSEGLARKRAFQVIINMQNCGLLETGDIFSYVIPNLNYNYQETNKKTQKYYFTDWINKRLETINLTQNSREIFIETTLDYKIQNKVEEVLGNFLIKNKNQIDKSQVAIIIINNNGEILSMIGGKNYDLSPFNRTLYAYRQTGSLFKMIVYLNAFEKGMHITDTFIDEPIAVKNWYPENVGKKYYGEVSVEEAFNKSMNSVAVQIANYFGLNNVIETAKKLGITSKFSKNDSTITLGTVGTNLLEMTKAYAIINNNGKNIKINNIKKIYDANNRILFQMNNNQENEYLFEDRSIGQMKKILYTTVINGTGKNALVNSLVNKTEMYNLLNKFDENYFIGGKTGSSQDSRDAWFIGFANDLTIGIWFGNDDSTPTKNIMGGNLPAKLWGEIVEEIIKN